MKLPKLFLLSAMVVLLGSLALAQTMMERDNVVLAKRATLAVKYPDNDGTSVDMIGTALQPRLRGRAEVKRKEGRTRIKLDLKNLQNPQTLGAFYTTYILWAVAPEGQADNMGELSVKGNESKIEVTTPYQTFGLIVTAEPYGTVKLPSPTIVAENILRDKTEGTITSSQIEYRGDSGAYYRVAATEMTPDFSTPLVVLGARRSVEIARRAGARQYAASELQEAENRLAVLESLWVAHRKHEEKFGSEARDVMRLAEQARSLAVERMEQARLMAERRAAGQAITESQNEADRAKSDAERARLEAERAKMETEDIRAALQRSEDALMAAHKNVEQAKTEAERAKANEEVARLEAERARLESQEAKQATAEARQQFEDVKRERDALQQRLFVSLSAILETRREARGLIVSLSDVLFDFNKATLKPGAREKLSKLAGILLAYPGKYQIEIEGHTDSIGSDDYNLKLSEDRAKSVRDYLNSAGIGANKIIAVRGFGKAKPVTTNDTAEGRQMNRRVEIIIGDNEVIPASVNGKNN
ncbi:MAG: OmpA family protein [Acidobacteria bacterium]|nr:OmpA family protein [Acidobacteriota bacterium]